MSVTTFPFLHINHLKKSVQTFEFNISILEDVNLQVNHGETIAIVGASGTGKTTLLSLIAGIDTPSSGQVYLKNHPIFELPEDQRATLRQTLIGFVFQSFLLLPSLSAIENVMLPLEIQNYSYDECYRRAYESLQQVELEHRVKHYPLQLSGGEQQRVAIARAFVTNPELILADEMTGNLDANTGKTILDLIFNLNKKNKTTIIFVTHDIDLAKQCDHYYELKNGYLHKC